jgi:hypothetical protein
VSVVASAASPAPSRTSATTPKPSPAPTPRFTPAVPSQAPREFEIDRSTRVLEALKEELFQLELDRHQGRVSDDEYQKAKAALDVTIARAATRAKS